MLDSQKCSTLCLARLSKKTTLGYECAVPSGTDSDSAHLTGQLRALPSRWLFCFSCHRWVAESAVKSNDQVLVRCWVNVLVTKPDSGVKNPLCVPLAVKSLGGKATEYAEALRNLAQGGNEPAVAAMSRLKDEIRKVTAKTRANPGSVWNVVNRTDASPVDIDPIAKWRLAGDAFGQYALELLLWLWHARQNPARYGPVGGVVAAFAPFDDDTCANWWKVGWMAVRHSYPRPQDVPELRALVKAPSYRRSSDRMRGYIVKRLHQRFLSFVAPPKR